MMAEELFVTWTMDCEPIAAEVPTGGPADWALSELAMRGYVEALGARGHRVTLFLVPRTGEVQAGVVRDLLAQGTEAGMHMHPQTTDYAVDAHLGQLPPATQRALLASGRDRLEAALGVRPTAFRPGCFSASDATYPILVDLGFTVGSVSLPGRRLPDVGADWAGAEPFAHWACADDRLTAGTLPFLELPTTVDLRDVPGPASAEGDARHLRLERPGIVEWAPDLIRRHLAAQVEAEVAIKSLVVMTHNTREYGDPGEPARVGLEAVADAIDAAAAELSLTVRPATLGEVRATVA